MAIHDGSLESCVLKRRLLLTRIHEATETVNNKSMGFALYIDNSASNGY